MTDTVADIIDNLRRVFQVVHEQSKKAKTKTGLTGPQLWAIKIISDSSPIRVCDLAKKIYLHPATVVGIIDRLEMQGLVARVRSKHDRRVVLVELTDNGKKLVLNAPTVAQGLLASGLEAISVSRLKMINSGLKEMVNILGAQELPPKLFLSSELNLPKRKIAKK